MMAEDGKKILAIPVIIGTEVREILIPYDATQVRGKKGIEKFKRLVALKYTDVESKIARLVDEMQE